MCKEYINIQTKEKLDMNKVNSLPDNAMLKRYPHVWKIWDFKKTDVDIFKFTYGSKKKVWWYCQKCDDSYPQAINKKCIGRGCSICKGYFVTKSNSFGDRFPHLTTEWHPTKNGELTPYNVSYGSGKRVWFKCNECTMEYDCTVDKKTTQNAKCPFCRGLRISPFNNFKATHPEIAKLWNYERNGDHKPEQYVKNNNSIKFHWKCSECGEEDYKTIKNKTSCLNCSDSLSFGERYMYRLLKVNNIEFEREKIFNWSNNKRYDFYIPSINTIIEIHGLQHYKESSYFNKRTSLKDIQGNDEYKHDLAKSNGIAHYIVIKSINQSLNTFIKEIELSGLIDLISIDVNLIKSVKIHKNYSIKVESWELWNDGLSVKEISDITKMSDRMIRRYLTDGTKLGKCDFPKTKRNRKLNEIT